MNEIEMIGEQYKSASSQIPYRPSCLQQCIVVFEIVIYESTLRTSYSNSSISSFLNYFSSIFLFIFDFLYLIILVSFVFLYLVLFLFLLIFLNFFVFIFIFISFSLLVFLFNIKFTISFIICFIQLNSIHSNPIRNIINKIS